VEDVGGDRETYGSVSMSYRPRENGTSPTVDLEDGTEARLELEALVHSAGLTNIIFALARFTSDRCEELREQDPVTAECWGRSAGALLNCGAKIDTLWRPGAEIDNSVRRAVRAERIGAQLADVVKRWRR